MIRKQENVYKRKYFIVRARINWRSKSDLGDNFQPKPASTDLRDQESWLPITHWLFFFFSFSFTDLAVFGDRFVWIRVMLFGDAKSHAEDHGPRRLVPTDLVLQRHSELDGFCRCLRSGLQASIPLSDSQDQGWHSSQRLLRRRRYMAGILSFNPSRRGSLVLFIQLQAQRRNGDGVETGIGTKSAEDMETATNDAWRSSFH